jgi:hypothetical protein
MKKTVMLLALVLPLVAMAADRPVEFNRLPAPARAFVEKYFADAEVLLATVDKDLLDTSYDVTFADGRKVEFDARGEWKEVDCGRGAVPAGVVPGAIVKYVEGKYPDKFVREVSRDKRHWEVTLDNGLELKFDTKFALVGVDD